MAEQDSTPRTIEQYREAYNLARERIIELLDEKVDLFSLPEGVTLERDGSGWFVECLYLDYFAGGDSPGDAIRRFWHGLLATIFVNLDKHGKFEPRRCSKSANGLIIEETA